MTSSGGRWALVSAHPGHELRVHHWLERNRPIVSFLTDGSGSSGSSRLASSEAVLASAAARPGRIFGRWTDREAYGHLMEGRFDRVREAVADLAEEFELEGVTGVAGDAAEGYNPIHDLCRSMINAAVEVLRGRGRGVTNLEFDLTTDPASPRHDQRLLLDDAALARKLGALARYAELAEEGAAAIDRFGVDRFRHEGFREVGPGPIHRSIEGGPEYERIGRQRVLEGRYPNVLRYDVHVLPLLARLQSWVDAEVNDVASTPHQ